MTFVKMLPSAPIVIVDTETGGFSKQRNPLMSTALLVTDPKGDALNQREFKFTPPNNTWLEIPALADQLRGKFDKKIEFWENVATGERRIAEGEKPDLLISAVAAETNHFVGASETVPGWNMAPSERWLAEGTDYAVGMVEIAKWLAPYKLNGTIAHAAQFDYDYLSIWLPRLITLLPLEWTCTQVAYKDKFLEGKTKGSSVGAILKHANWVPAEDTPLHSSLGDVIATHHIWKWLREQGC